MKKAAISCVLVFLAVRLALFAGAGEALAAWVRDAGSDSSVISDVFGLDPIKENEEIADEYEIQSGFILVPVTPAPQVEEGVNLGEKIPPDVQSTTISSTVSVRNDTGYEIDLEALAAEGVSLSLPADGPQILIIHTHGSEAYTRDSEDNYEESDPYRTEDCSYNVIRVGDRLTELFESCGLQVIHDREIYDYPSYTGSYNRSGAAVQDYLEQYPSLQIVIDLHRDALGSGDVVYKTQAEVSGRSASQVMLLVGTGENGLYHPNWKENLKLALYMQSAMDSSYPTLARPISLKQERYNQHLTQGSLILEVGSTGNTLQEALCAIELFASAVGPALAELIE